MTSTPRRVALRRAVNWVNLTTPLGLLVARVGGATLLGGRHGSAQVLVATGYRLRVPANPAFTVGDVVVVRRDAAWLADRPRLLAHEARHAAQYAWCVGLPFLPAYAVAALWSLVRVKDPATRNVFERLAGLADGGYVRATAEVHDRRHG